MIKRFSAIIFLLLLLLYSCIKTENTKNHHVRDSMTEINRTSRLSIGDSVIGFGGKTDNKKSFDIMSLDRNVLFIFFDNSKSMVLLNEEIKTKDIGKLAQQKNIDILFASELKMANSFGVEFTEPPNRKFKHSILFIADNEKKIERIFKDVSEDDIVELLLNEY